MEVLNYLDAKDEDTRAITLVFDQSFDVFDPSRDDENNWRYGAIYFNTRDHSNFELDTVAHEVGHFFGLSHRVSELNSIMQKFYFVNADQSPADEYNYKNLSDDDLSVFRHIYK